MIAAPSSAAAQSAPCLAPVDQEQARLDEAGLANAAANGLDLSIVRQCAGFSIVAQAGVDGAAADEFTTFAEKAYVRLAGETNRTLAPRAVLFLFADQDGMALGEQVIAGIAELNREPIAGYALFNSVWIDVSRMRTSARRAQAAAHEFTHVFAGAVARGRPVPTWFNEGLAVDSEIEIPADDFPAASRARDQDMLDVVLDATAGAFPVPLFALQDLSANRGWNANFSDPDKQDLEYAQAYETLRLAMGSGGRPTAWTVLSKYGEGGDFDQALRSVYGKSSADIDGAARAEWQALVDTASSAP